MKLSYLTSTNLEEIELDDILYFESQERLISVSTIRSKYEIETTLKDLEEILLKQGFVRISKWCVLNVTKIKNFKRLRNQQIKIILVNNSIVYVNRTYLKNFIFFIKKGMVYHGK